MWKAIAPLAAAYALDANVPMSQPGCNLAAATAADAGEASDCQRAWMDRNLKLNDLLAVGTHNSWTPAKTG